MANKKNIIIFFAMLAALLSGCQADRVSILWTLKDATVQIDTQETGNLTIRTMEKVGLDYYIACGTVLLHHKNPYDTDEAWNELPYPSKTIKSCTTVAYYDSVLFAGFMYPDGTGDLYFSSTLPPALASDWTRVNAPDITNERQIVKLIKENNLLFISTAVVTGASDYFSLGQYDGGSDTYSQTGFETLKPVHGIISLEYDGTEYWLVTSTDVYKTNAPDISAPQVYTNTGISGNYGGLFYSSSNRYYLSTNHGVVYWASNPITEWTGISASTDLLGNAIKFTELAQISSNVMIGSIRNGFYEIDDTTPTLLERQDEAQYSDLYTAYVASIFVDDVPARVYFCTAGSGLFMNTYPWSESWTHE